MDRLLLDMKKHFPEMSIIVVSHDLASLYTIADYALVLHDGKAVYSGGIEQLKGTDDPYLRQFLDRSAGDMKTPDLKLGEEARAALQAWLNK
jgi:phospholipid/cholesterol/gamma-HCH transport system ATP-binding protein